MSRRVDRCANGAPLLVTAEAEGRLPQISRAAVRALTIISDTAIVRGALMLTLAFVARTLSLLPWIISAGIADTVILWRSRG